MATIKTMTTSRILKNPMLLTTIILVLFFLFAPSARADVDASFFSDQYGLRKRADKVPVPLLFVGEGTKAIIVDKKAHTLYLFNGTKLIMSYNITSGRKHGDKWREGDLKTPEGIYFFNRRMERAELDAQYGVLALITDYPNPLDKAIGKGGTNIWLHATNEPERLSNPNDSRGCVVGTDADILDIASRIALFDTPIIIVDKLRYHSIEAADAELKELLDSESSFASLNIKTEGLKVLGHGTEAVVSYKLGTAVKFVYLKRGGAKGGGPWQTWQVVAKKEKTEGAVNRLSAKVKGMDGSAGSVGLGRAKEKNRD